MKWHHADSAEMLLIAVRPDYQGMGVNALFFDDLIPIYNQYGFKWAETGPQLEDNIRELSQWRPLQPERIKRRRCLRAATWHKACSALSFWISPKPTAKRQKLWKVILFE